MKNSLCVLMLFGPFLVFGVWLAFTLCRTINAISPERRELSPLSVWFCFLPVAGQIWNFLMVERIAASLENEFTFRGYDRTGESFGRKPGQSWARLTVATLITLIPGTLIPNSATVFIPLLLGIAACWKALEYGYVMHAHWKHLNGKGVAHRTSDERDFDDDYRAGDEE